MSVFGSIDISTLIFIVVAILGTLAFLGFIFWLLSRKILGRLFFVLLISANAVIIFVIGSMANLPLTWIGGLLFFLLLITWLLYAGFFGRPKYPRISPDLVALNSSPLYAQEKQRLASAGEAKGQLTQRVYSYHAQAEKLWSQYGKQISTLAREIGMAWQHAKHSRWSEITTPDFNELSKRRFQLIDQIQASDDFSNLQYAVDHFCQTPVSVSIRLGTGQKPSYENGKEYANFSIGFQPEQGTLEFGGQSFKTFDQLRAAVTANWSKQIQIYHYDY
ncbi:MAG: hypothetical protein KF716_30645 [Anaerolineae bacterium]|nr:hypothetical protein [Anaerolineae bacterium]